MKQFQEFKQDIERELMIKIIIGLRHGKISQSRAQKLAQEYLNLTNASNADELFNNMSKIIERYSEILEVYIKTATEYFDQKREYVLSEARKYLQRSQYDHALIILKKGEN